MSRPRPAKVDQTPEFRTLLQGCEQYSSPPAPPKLDSVREKQLAAAQAWLTEAYRIKRHISSLYTFLSTIRRPYLDITSTSKRLADRDDAMSNPVDGDDALAKWQHITSLSESERDEVDFQVKLVVKRCLDRVQELERGEKLRREAAERTFSSASVSAFAPLRLLNGNAQARQKAASDAVGMHHSSITQYLSEQLARVSSIQATMQQRRAEAQRQRYEKLSDGAKNAAWNAARHTDATAEVALRGTVGALDAGKDDLTYQLSPEQLQTFEQEASALIQSLHSDLQAVHHAEQQLHDISELQTRIVQHLQEQNEHTSNLFAETAVHGDQVTSGNVQLRRAKERNRRANQFLSLFFVLSGLVLLLMHWLD
ncbi:hypothetical protein MVES1_001195 [Malassezia vespertilionis]|nr:uncharacterized protein MVES1_001195 [Malassezia vespertilionis]WFD05861.1 hypothetical protein MVES1_001195 [Malassezia vespertilionis]